MINYLLRYTAVSLGLHCNYLVLLRYYTISYKLHNQTAFIICKRCEYQCLLGLQSHTYPFIVALFYIIILSIIVVYVLL